MGLVKTWFLPKAHHTRQYFKSVLRNHLKFKKKYISKKKSNPNAPSWKNDGTVLTLKKISLV